MIQPTISLEMPVPSQDHYGFHSFPVADWFFLFIYLWVLTFPLSDCSEFGNFVITLISYIVTKKIIERLLRGDLSYKATFSLSQGWPLNTGLTVLYTLGWPLNTGLTVLYTFIYHNIFQLSISNMFNIIKNIKRNV